MNYTGLRETGGAPLQLPQAESKQKPPELLRPHKLNGTFIKRAGIYGACF